jgi:hypothetical protein
MKMKSGNSSTNVCISKTGSLWNSTDCKTEFEENPDDPKDITVVCNCKSLSANTVVNDLKSIFLDSKLDDVFSGGGFDAFKNMEVHKFAIFWILLIKTFIFIYSLRFGFRKDSEE